MRTLQIGNVTITGIVERDGPWRRPEDMFPAYDPDVGQRHLALLDREVFDPVSVIGPPTAADLERCRELGATVAAGLTLDAD